MSKLEQAEQRLAEIAARSVRRGDAIATKLHMRNETAELVARFQGKITKCPAQAYVAPRKKARVVLGDATAGRATLQPGKAVRAGTHYYAI